MIGKSTAETDRRILEIAGRQYGALARRQLLEAGLSERDVQYRLETGRLRPIHRGVYAVGPVAGEHQRAIAAVLACGDRCHLGRLSAAAHWGMAAARLTRPVAVITPRDVRLKDPGIRVCRVARLFTDEVTVKDRLPLTTPARTILDLAGWVSDAELERALAIALRERLLKLDELRHLLDRHPRQPGRARLLALLALDAGPAFLRSKAERLFLELVLSGGLNRPETNVVVCGYEVDFFWRRERLVVEIDGRKYHSHDPSFENDRDRGTALVAAGYRVMRVTWKQMTEERDKVIVRVTRALMHGSR